RGAILDVGVDIRRDSPTFGKWLAVELSADNAHMIYFPPTFAHGFLTLADDTDFLYKCTAPYAPQSEYTLAWDDPAVGIEWPVTGLDPVISDKDTRGLALGDVPVFA
ncbi:MAG: dTDP-4-dehydrorhamnose 3,5-epimerase, partial [Erythrobacter sp.]|nr:dTDP-4-dehydrorhamnose 3,5-epimerase [Erythrobacter sp.]